MLLFVNGSYMVNKLLQLKMTAGFSIQFTVLLLVISIYVEMFKTKMNLSHTVSG